MALTNCRISQAPEWTGKKFYCDACVQYFDDNEHRPCSVSQLLVEETAEETVIPTATKKRRG